MATRAATMRRVASRPLVGWCGVLLVLALANPAGAQDPGIVVRDAKVDSGGGTITGGNFSVTGMAGVFEAGTGSASGGEFGLVGGMAPTPPDGAPPSDVVFANSFE